MIALKQPDADDKRTIVQMVDQVLAGTPAESARVVMVIQHAPDENPIPYLLDYIESRGCRVENVFTARWPTGHIQRELVIRHGSDRRPWDGSVE